MRARSITAKAPLLTAAGILVAGLLACTDVCQWSDAAWLDAAWLDAAWLDAARGANAAESKGETKGEAKSDLKAAAKADLKAAAKADAQAAALPVKFPLDLRIIDPASEMKQPPAIIVFEKGLDTQGKDVSRALGRLKALRGDSKMFPKLNEDPGLPVVLRGLRFHKEAAANGAEATYSVDLLGEFNRVRVPVTNADMAKFLAGERVELKLKGTANYGVYAYESSIAMELRFAGNGLTVFRVTGDFQFRELLTTFVSATRKIDLPAGREHLYKGEVGELPDLPAI